MVHVNPLLSKFAVADDLFALLSWTQLLGFPPFLYFSTDLCPAVLHQHPYCETWTSEYKHRWQSSQVKSCLRGHSGSPCSSCWCSCCEDRIGTCAAAHPTGVCVCVCVWSFLLHSLSRSEASFTLYNTKILFLCISGQKSAAFTCCALLAQVTEQCTVHSACFCMVTRTCCAAFHLTPASPPPSFSLRGFGLWLAKLVS